MIICKPKGSSKNFYSLLYVIWIHKAENSLEHPLNIVPYRVITPNSKNKETGFTPYELIFRQTPNRYPKFVTPSISKMTELVFPTSFRYIVLDTLRIDLQLGNQSHCLRPVYSLILQSHDSFFRLIHLLPSNFLSMIKCRLNTRVWGVSWF